MEKQKKHKIGIIVVLGITLLICILIAIKYYQHQKRLDQNPFFTEYKLSQEELEVLVYKFNIEITPNNWMDVNREDKEWPDFSYYTMQETQLTEIAVEVINHYVFALKHMRIPLETAKMYGLSSENPLTVEWVMQHPKETVEIVELYDSFLDNDNSLLSHYEEITGKSIEME